MLLLFVVASNTWVRSYFNDTKSARLVTFALNKGFLSDIRKSRIEPRKRLLFVRFTHVSITEQCLVVSEVVSLPHLTVPWPRTGITPDADWIPADWPFLSHQPKLHTLRYLAPRLGAPSPDETGLTIFEFVLSTGSVHLISNYFGLSAFGIVLDKRCLPWIINGKHNVCVFWQCRPTPVNSTAIEIL